jgi:hypothetical protein
LMASFDVSFDVCLNHVGPKGYDEKVSERGSAVIWY